MMYKRFPIDAKKDGIPPVNITQRRRNSAPNGWFSPLSCHFYINIVIKISIL